MNYGIPRIIEIKWCGTMKKDYLMEISQMIFKVDKLEFYFSQKKLKTCSNGPESCIKRR